MPPSRFRHFPARLGGRRCTSVPPQRDDPPYARRRPGARERFKRSVRGAPQTPGIITVTQKLQRRTQIDPATLEIQVDKRP